MIHVYAFAAATAAAPEVAGLDGERVERLDVGDVAAFFSRHERAPEAADESVLRHAEIVEAVMQGAGAVLPARFGLAYEDEAALQGAVEERAGALDARLRQVRGCVELGLRVLAREATPEAVHAPSGAEYLRARLRETNERQRVADELHESLRVHARDCTHNVPPSGRLLLSASYLVPAEARARFEEQVHELERRHRDLALVCTGPWPPYSFAAAAGEAA